MTSLLKAYWGDAATEKNDFCYDYLPKRSGNYSFIKLMERLQGGGFEGLVCMGTNPDRRRPRCRGDRQWPRQSQVDGRRRSVGDRDFGLLETSRRRSRRTIDTEVFLLPAASSVEKDGTISNSGRWVQWRYKAVNPPGARRKRRLYGRSVGQKPEGPVQERQGRLPRADHRSGLGVRRWPRAGHRPGRQRVQRPVHPRCGDQGRVVQEGAAGAELSPTCRPTVRPPAATGSTATPTPRRAT